MVDAISITAGVFINDDGNGLYQDYEIWLEKLAWENHTSNVTIMDMKVMQAYI